MRGPAAACLLILVTGFFAGCLATDEAPNAVRRLDQDGSLDGAWPELLTGAPGANDQDSASLDHPPDWRIGQWWTYDYRHERTDVEGKVTLVVVGATNGTYHVGMPAEAFDAKTLVFHVPPVGDVGRGTLAYGVHDKVFEPLRFPLSMGKSWTTHWQNDADTLEAEVTATTETTADIEMIGPTRHVVATYDATIGHLSAFDMQGYGSYELTDSGYGYDGEVVVPHAHAPLILESRVNTVYGTGNAPEPPVETIELDGDYNEISLLLMAGPTAAPTPTPTRIDVFPPDGGQYVLMGAPRDNVNPATLFATEDTVAGEWQLRLATAGIGFAFVEGIAYDKVAYTLE